MAIRVSLSRFVQYLDSAKEFDRTHPAMDQTGWLLCNWAFDDTGAHYEPLPAPRPFEIAPAQGPFMSWFRRLARN